MRLQAATVAGERHVHKVLVIAQILERRCDAALVVVPAQAEMLCVCHFISVLIAEGFFEVGWGKIASSA